MNKKRYKLGQILYIISKDCFKIYVTKSRIVRIQYNDADEDYHYYVKTECDQEIDMWYSYLNKTLENLEFLAFTKKNDAIDYHNKLTLDYVEKIQEKCIIK